MITIYWTSTESAEATDFTEHREEFTDALPAAQWMAQVELYENLYPVKWTATTDGERRRVDAIRKGRRFGAPLAHVDYPHQPGTLYDCPGCGL